jgi:membrane-anchored protein YejM (alkaline phosphatase superfamily)
MASSTLICTRCLTRWSSSCGTSRRAKSSYENGIIIVVVVVAMLLVYYCEQRFGSPYRPATGVSINYPTYYMMHPKKHKTGV